MAKKIKFNKPVYTISLFLIAFLSMIASTVTFLATGYGGDGIKNNVDLVTPSLEGTVTWGASVIYDIFAFLTGNFAANFSPTSDILYKLLLTTRNSDMFNFFYTLGYILTIVVFGISFFVICVGGIFENKNNIIELIIRMFIAIVSVALSRKILDRIAEFADELYQILFSQLTSDRVYTDADLSFLNAQGIGDQIWGLLLGIILLIAFIIEYVKLMLEIMERYIVVELLKIFAPTVSGLIVSRTTSQVFVNYYRMYLSQLFLLLMNVFFQHAISVMSPLVVALETTTLLGYLMLISFTKTAQRIDQHMKSLGLTVAQTGGAFLSSLMGAVGTMSTLGKLGKGGAGFIGAAAMSRGAATGNYGLFKAGAKAASVGKNGIAGAIMPLDEGAALKSFASTGGGMNAVDAVNSKKSKDALVGAITGAYKKGDYASLGSFKRSSQTAAAKEILGSNGAFKAATGYDVSAIKNATIDKNGNIIGTIGTGGDGTSKFKVSADSLRGRSGSIDCIDGQTRNIQTSGNMHNLEQKSYGSYEYDSASGGMSNLSTLSGLDLNDDRLASLGASSYMYDANDNMLYIADDDGNVVYQRGMETGNEIFAGDTKGTGAAPDITKKDFAIDGKLYDYAPGGVQKITPDSDKNSVRITTYGKDTSSPGDNIYVSGPKAKFVAPGQGANAPSVQFIGNQIPLNDKKTKIIDNGNKGSFAVYGKSLDTGRKISPK